MNKRNAVSIYLSLVFQIIFIKKNTKEKDKNIEEIIKHIVDLLESIGCFDSDNTKEPR